MLENKSHTILRLLLRKLSKRSISTDGSIVLDYWSRYTSNSMDFEVLPHWMCYFISSSCAKGTRFCWVIDGMKNLNLGIDKNGRTRRYASRATGLDKFRCQSLEAAHQRCVDDFEQQIKILDKGINDHANRFS